MLIDIKLSFRDKEYITNTYTSKTLEMALAFLLSSCESCKIQQNEKEMLRDGRARKEEQVMGEGEIKMNY